MEKIQHDRFGVHGEPLGHKLVERSEQESTEPVLDFRGAMGQHGLSRRLKYVDLNYDLRLPSAPHPQGFVAAPELDVR